MRTLSIIIVSFNTRALTLACLESVLAAELPEDTEIIVVDNASEDESADAIAASFPEVRLIRSDENLGFARANNLAASMADCSYLLLLNPDTVIRPNSIRELLAFANERRTAGIWGGRTLYADGLLNPSSCWRRMTLWNQTCRALGLSGVFAGSRLFNSEAYGAWKRDSMREVDIVSGCFLLIRSTLWQDLQGFDEQFFMYGEEADLCLRARRQGARPAVSPAATIVHYGGASEIVRADMIVRVLAAKVKLVHRHWHLALRPLGVALLKFWCLSRCFVPTAIGADGDESAGWIEVWRRRAEWSRPAKVRPK